MVRILITHTDLDGLGSAILAIAEKLVDKIYCWNNNWTDQKVLGKGKIIITDLSLPVEWTKRATVYDHHPASKDTTFNGICDEKRCGTRLFYEEYMTKPKHKIARDRFVYLVDIYDRWQPSEADFDQALDLNRLFNEMVSNRSNCLLYDGRLLNSPYKSFVQAMLKTLEQKEFQLSPTLKETIEKARKKEDEAYIKALEKIQVRTDSQENKFAIARMPCYMNENTHRYLYEHEDVRYILNLGRNGISARSIDDTFDLNRLQGMAGHPKATGGAYALYFINQLESGEIHELGYKQN